MLVRYSVSLNLMEIVPAILDLVDNLNSPTVNKNKKGKHRGIGYSEQFPFSCWFAVVAKYCSCYTAK